jgi:hypothetical protein
VAPIILPIVNEVSEDRRKDVETEKHSRPMGQLHCIYGGVDRLYDIAHGGAVDSSINIISGESDTIQAFGRSSLESRISSSPDQKIISIQIKSDNDQLRYSLLRDDEL